MGLKNTKIRFVKFFVMEKKNYNKKICLYNKIYMFKKNNKNLKINVFF